MSTFTAQADVRLDVAVSEALPELSRSRAARLIRDGRVRVGGTVVRKAAHTVLHGDEVVVEVPPPVPAEARPQDLPLRIAHEDPDVVVVDKHPGMVVHPGAGHPDGTLVNALLHHVGDLSGIGGVERPGIVHRLDRGTSGLLVVAKHDQAHQHLASQFADHSAGRRYLAVCHGEPVHDGGVAESLLGRHPRDRVRFASVDRGGKPAVTHWRVLGRGRGLSLIGCRLETGRTHQIRVHLSELGHALVGDPLYDRRKRTLPVWLRPLVDDDRPLLHAWRLHFVHPRTGQDATFEAPVPDDMLAVLDAAGLRSALPRALD